MQISNIQIIEKYNALFPSSMKMVANTMDGGQVKSEGKFNPFMKQPTFMLDLTLTHMNISALANFLKHFTAVDVEGGQFDLYVELAAGKNRIIGYAKPFIRDLKIGQPKNGNPIEWLYDGAAAFFSKVLENSQQQTLATKIKISGKIDDPDTSILSILGYIFRHAFIEALVPKIDNSIKAHDVISYPPHQK